MWHSAFQSLRSNEQTLRIQINSYDLWITLSSAELFSPTVLIFMRSITLPDTLYVSCRSLVVNGEIKLENTATSAQYQTPALDIHFTDLAVDSLGCFFGNIGSRQSKYSQWVHLLTYQLGSTPPMGFWASYMSLNGKPLPFWDESLVSCLGAVSSVLLCFPGLISQHFIWLSYWESLQWVF